MTEKIGKPKKEKTIKLILNRWYQNFIESIEDEKIQKVIREESFVTGGAIASMLLGEKVNDLDIYFYSKKAANLTANYYISQYKKNNPDNNLVISLASRDNLEEPDCLTKVIVKSAGVATENKSKYQYFEMNDQEGIGSQEYLDEVIDNKEKEENKSKKYRPVMFTSNAITLSHGIQLILRFTGKPDEIHKNYDFVHCKNYWIPYQNELFLKKRALVSLLTKELKYTGSLYPFCSILRAKKFIERGWSINAGQFLKMAWQLNSLDLNDLEVLEDQLTGVDAAYFMEVLDILRADMEDKKTKKIDATYLMQLIDKVF